MENESLRQNAVKDLRAIADCIEQGTSLYDCLIGYDFAFLCSDIEHGRQKRTNMESSDAGITKSEIEAAVNMITEEYR